MGVGVHGEDLGHGKADEAEQSHRMQNICCLGVVQAQKARMVEIKFRSCILYIETYIMHQTKIEAMWLARLKGW